MPSSGQVVIPPGETIGAFVVALLDDALAEGTETFGARLVAATGARLGAGTLGDVGITDDDGGNPAPVAVNDVVATVIDKPVDIPALANDRDPDGDPLALTAVTVPGHGSATFAGGIVTYAPAAGFEGIDHFLYTITDGPGHTATAAVSVYVNETPLPPPPPPVLTVTPSFLDFGQVPLGKTKDLVLTVANNTAAPVALAEGFFVIQQDPSPFDATSYYDGCSSAGDRVLEPGQSCTKVVRFWSVAGAGAASPATLRLIASSTFEPLAIVPLFASVGPEDTGPNSKPVPVDDLAGAAAGFTHTLDALRNDSDPDHDILHIVAVSDPPHGTAAVVSCGGVIFYPTRGIDCIQYVPDAGYEGIDAIPYTVSDGRGGTATAVYHIAVGNLVPVVSAITPNRGPTSGGQTVRITGSNFVYRSEASFVCDFGSIVPLQITHLTDNEILATTPQWSPGVCALRVRTLFSQVGQLAAAYTYTNSGGAPVANDLSATIAQGTTATIGLVATDPDGDPLTFSVVAGPSHGSLSPIAGSQVTYTPNTGYSGPDSFTFKANDGQADSNVATVSLAVTPAPPLVIDVVENVVVTDTGMPRTAVVLNVAESIVVTDAPRATPPLTLTVSEVIVVSDSTAATPPLTINVAETIVVTDTPIISSPTPTPTSVVVSAVSGFEEDEIDAHRDAHVAGRAGRGPSDLLHPQRACRWFRDHQADGVATLNGVSLSGMPIGVHPRGCCAPPSPGAPALGASTATASLTVLAIDPADLVVWVSTATPGSPSEAT